MQLSSTAPRVRIGDRNIYLVYGTIFLLGIAYGMAIALLPLELDRRGFTERQMGTLASVFALGIVALSLPMGSIVRRITPQRTLLLALLGYAFTVGIFPVLNHIVPVALSRFADGAFSVGIWVSCETILLERADKEHRAFVTSLYAMAMAIGYIVGPLLARALIARVPSAYAFYAAAGMATAAALVASRITPRPVGAPDVHGEDAHASDPAAGASGEAPRLTSLQILSRTKTSCFATFAYGYFQAAVVLFLPLYLMREKGVPKNNTILVTAFFALGMLLFSNFAGQLGDRFGHLRVMRVLAVIGATMIAGFIYLPSFALMCAAVLVAGGTLAPISPVSLALQGVVTADRDLGRANGIYNAFYAVGMLVGPLVSSQIFQASGGAPMLLHFVGLWGCFVLFAWVYAKDDPRRRGEGFRSEKVASV